MSQFKELDALESNRDTVEDDASNEDFLAKPKVGESPLSKASLQNDPALAASKLNRKMPAPSTDMQENRYTFN